MSNQATNNAPFTFHDVTACFSVEEWKLLREWQNELYTNVMKEIHQAMISLEPVIATYVFSLKAKEMEDQLPVDCHISPEGHSNHHSPSETVSGVDLNSIVREDNQQLHEPLSRNGQEYNYNLSAGHAIAIPVMSTSIKNEEDAYLIAYPDLNQMETQHSNFPTGHDAVMSATIKEEAKTNLATCQEFMETRIIPGPKGHETVGAVMTASIKEEAKTDPAVHPGPNETENNQCPKGLAEITAVVSFCIKDEEESCLIDHQISESKGSSSNFSCAPAGTSVYSQNLMHNSEVHLQEVEEYKSENTGYQANTPIMLVNIKEERETCLTDNQDPKERQDIIYPAPHKAVKMVHVKDTHECSSCKKNFTRKSTLKRHQQIHTGVKPLQCTACEENFMKKTDLLQHMKTHKEMCPSNCTDRGKIDLLQHPELHTGSKPFVCTECKKVFSQKIDLQRHQRIHTGARLFNARNVKKALFKRHTF